MTSTMKPEEKKSEDFDEAHLESIMQGSLISIHEEKNP